MLRRMSDRSRNQKNISQLSEKELKEQGWKFEEEREGTCIQCRNRVTVETYYHESLGLASIRIGCSH
jgi:hypothetical protein